MSEPFDPYYTWLAIPPEEQPPNHYRLLGLRLFESKPEVIENAADQRMAHLRAIQKGQRVKLAQQLLNEVSAARIALLTESRKAEYDARLRAELEAQAAQVRHEDGAEVSLTLGQFLEFVREEQRQPGQSGIGRRAPAAPAAAAPQPVRGAPPPSPSERRMKQTIYVGIAAVCVLLAAIGVAWLARGGPGGGEAGAAGTALVFDWPQDEREGAEVFVDGKPLTLPKSGALAHACEAGERRVRAVRKGYKPFETVVKVGRGERKPVTPAWRSLSRLVIEWPAGERTGARLSVNGRSYNLGAFRDDAHAVRLTVDPGEQVVRIERRGCEPFEQRVQVLEGDSRSLAVAFRKAGEAGTPGEKPADPGPPKPKPEDGAGTKEPAPPGESTGLLPAPPEAVRQEIVKRLDEVYGSAAAAGPAKAAIARKMLEAEEKYRQSPDERYALLWRAAELAAEGGDPDLAFQAADGIAADYAADSVGLKVQAMKAFADGAAAPSHYKALLEKGDAVIDLALGADRYAPAADLADKIYEACSRSPGKPFRKQAYDRRAEVQRVIQEHGRFLAALETLQANSDDADAATVAGLWLCVKRGDWEQGLPHLAKGADAAVKTVAEQDLRSAPAGPEEQVALGDQWWDLAQSAKGSLRDAWLMRAGHWYRLAEADASSAVLKDKIGQRLAVTDKIRPPTGAKPLGQRKPGEPLRPNEWIDVLSWIAPERDGNEGAWTRVQEGVRAVTAGSQRARLTAPVAVQGDYDLQVEFTAAKGPSCPAVVILPVGDRACLLVLFGWSGKISGLELIDGQAADRNLTITSVDFAEATRYRVAVSVRLEGERAKISTTLNGEPHVGWEGMPASLGVAEAWRLPRAQSVGLGNSGADTTFHVLRLKLLSGTATYAPAPRAAGTTPAPVQPKPDLPVAVPKPAPPGVLGRYALVAEPGPVPGAAAWTIETVGLRGEVWAMAFHPKEDLLATGGEDAAIRLWSAESGKFQKVLLGHSGRIQDLAFSPDGARLASGARDGTVRVWDWETGRTVWAADDRTEWASSVAFSPDGQTLVTAGREEGLHFYEAASGRRTESVDRGATGNHYRVAWSPDGGLIATAGDDRMVRLWDAASRSRVRELEMGDGGGWGAVCWARDGQTLVSLRGGVMYHWSVGGELRRKFATEIAHCALLPDNATVMAATVGRNNLKAVQFWELATGRMSSQQDRPPHETGITALAVSREGKTCAIACPLGVRIVHAGRAGAPVQLPVHTGPVLDAAFSPDGRFLACANRGHSARIWEVGQGTLAKELTPVYGPDSAVRAVAWSHDGKFLAGDVSHGDVGNTDSRLFLWDARSGSVPARCNVGWRPAPCVLWHPSGKALAYGGGKTQIFDPASGKRIIEFDPQSNALAWTPDGKYLAVRPQDGDEVRFCDPATGQAFRTIKTPRADQRVGALAFSPDGKRIACGVRDPHGACVLDVDRGTVAVEMRHQHESPVRAILWLDEGKTLVTGSETETCAWEAETGKLTQRIQDGGDVLCAARGLVVQRGASTVRFRSLADGRVLQTILSLAGQESAVISPDGHYRGSRGVKKELVYVVAAEAGQETLSPDEFARKYNWRNAPSQVRQF